MTAISVIVPAFNVVKYIEFCIDSILAQDFRDFEIIVVDDASTDGTWEVCEKLYGNNSMVKLYRHEENRGVSVARNTGLSLASGKYVMFVDSDDMILWNALSALYEAAEAWNADIVSADRYLRAEVTNDRLLNTGDSLKHMAAAELVQEPTLLPDDLRARLSLIIRYGMLVFAWNRLYLREFLLSHHISQPNDQILGEDILFHFACVFHAKIYVRIPDVFYIYCKNPDSIVRKKKPGKWVGYIAKSMVLGVRYIYATLSRLRFFQENPDALDTVVRLFLENFKYEHVAKGKFYADYAISPEVDCAVKSAFTPIFGEDADFVKYLFHVMNIHFAEACNLLDENAALKAEIERLKNNCAK